MVGGLAVSQALTLLTTPIVYIYLDKLQHVFRRHPKSGAAELVLAAD